MQRGFSCFQLGNGIGKTFRHLLVREACSDDLELLNFLSIPSHISYSPRRRQALTSTDDQAAMADELETV